MDIVPFVDLAAHHAPIKDQIEKAVTNVISHGKYILGPEVEAFEKGFAAMVGAKHGIGVGTGLDALRLAFEAAGVKAGDEVIVPGNTFIATALAVSAVGAVPVLVDCDEVTYNIDPSLIEAVITKKTKAICPVHLYGQAADLDPILAIAQKHGLKVIEDDCQAHGDEVQGHGLRVNRRPRHVQLLPRQEPRRHGRRRAWSRPTTTSWRRRCGGCRSYGEAKKYHHVEKGLNARLDTMQAAILGVKLPAARVGEREPPPRRAGLREGPRGHQGHRGAEGPGRRDGAHLSPVRHPHAEARGAPEVPPRQGHPDRHPLPDPDSHAAGLRGARARAAAACR